MTKTASWKRRAQHAIRTTLDTLPLDTPKAEVRAQLAAAYPFGEPTGLPWKVWTRELRAALRQRDAAQRVRQAVAA